jgi:hypothetical protein
MTRFCGARFASLCAPCPPRHTYAGDLFDHLREADNTTRLEYEERFQRIFPRDFPAQDTEPIPQTQALFVEGNHDVGLGVV